MTEASKILSRVLPMLREKTVLDLGCGEEKIVPWAVGVDDGSEWDKPTAADVLAGIFPHLMNKSLTIALLKAGKEEKYDVVFSSHSLEHCPTPVRDTISYWTQFLKDDGLLVLYLPDENHYVYDPNNKKARNPAHYHYLTPDIVRWHIEQISNLKIEQFEPDIGEDRYSFLVVARKIAV